MSRAADIAIRFFVYGAVVFGGFVFFYPVGGGKQRSTKTMCLSRMKNLSVAALIYADNHGDTLPAKSWMEAIKPYGHKLSFTCGKLEEDENLKWGFAMERSVAGKALTSFKDPDKQPLFIETDTLAPNIVTDLKNRSRKRHGMGSNVAFSDASVRFCNYDSRAPDTGAVHR